MQASSPTIVFDLDGTLVHTAHDIVATLNHVLAADGMAPVALETALSMVGHGSRVLLENAYAAANRPLSLEDLDARVTMFLAHYNDHLADNSAPFPGVEAALQRLSDDGWRLAVCTNKMEAPARKLLDLLGLGSRFAAITGQDTFDFRKPDPRHLTETVRLAGGDAANAIMVGDSRTDVDAANAAGIPVIGVDFGYTPVPMAELQPTRVISHFDELYEAAQSIRK